MEVAQRCSVCDRIISAEVDEGRAEIALCGAASPFYECPCCKRSVPELDEEYLRRCANFVAAWKEEE